MDESPSGFESREYHQITKGEASLTGRRRIEMKIKSVVIMEENQDDFEKAITDLLTGKDVWNPKPEKIISISYNYNRELDAYKVTLYSALVVYEY